MVKPVNLDALSKWVGKIPKDVVADMENVAVRLAGIRAIPEAGYL